MGEFFLYSFFAAALLLIFPVIADVDLYFDAAENRGWFSVSLYHKIRLYGGYAELRREGAVFHLTKKRAVILPYSGFPEVGKKFEITRGFQLMRLHQVLETGGAQDARGMWFAAVFSALGGAIYAYLKEDQPFLSFRSRAICHSQRCLRGCLQLSAAMNLLVLFIALMKKLTEVLLIWIKKRRSTVSLRKLQKNLRGS